MQADLIFPTKYLGSQYFTADHKYGLTFNDTVIMQMIELASRSGCNETGGIIVGHYTHDLTMAVVTRLSSQSTDSKSGTTWFFRGVQQLHNWLKRLWQENPRHYYLGEWHSHPGGAPIPSVEDIRQMNEIAVNEDYQCREPILIIIGGNITSHPRFSAFVFPKWERYRELSLVQSVEE